METVKILHTADIHIGAPESFLGDSSSRRFETVITFEKIIDLARQSGVQIILIAGDLFDSNNVPERFITPVFEKIASVPEIKVVFAAGNHDPLSLDSPFKAKKMPENLYVMDTEDDCKIFEDLKVKVYGKSFENVYMQGSESFSLKPENGYINLCVLHGDARSDLNSDYNSVTPNFIRNSGMDYIALGHIHMKSNIEKLGETHFAYSGCPEGHGFDELGAKGVLIGEIGKGVCTLEFAETSKRKYLYETVNIDGLSTSSQIAEKVLCELKEKYGEDFGENLYKIRLSGEIGEEVKIDTDEIFSRLENSLYFVKIKDSTEVSIDLEELSSEVSLKGIFVKNMLEKIAAADNKDELKRALKIGLKAFSGEVEYNED